MKSVSFTELDNTVNRIDDDYLNTPQYEQQQQHISKNGMNPLDHQIRKLQKLLVIEQDKFGKISKQLHTSESTRLELVSQSNKEVFALNTKYAKARNELEKSETLRQNLEYELNVVKCKENREKNQTVDREKMMDELKKTFDSKLLFYLLLIKFDPD